MLELLPKLLLKLLPKLLLKLSPKLSLILTGLCNRDSRPGILVAESQMGTSPQKSQWGPLSDQTPPPISPVLDRDSQPETSPRKPHPGFSTGILSREHLPGILNRDSHRDSQPETSPRYSHPGFSTGNLSREISSGILTGILNRVHLSGILNRDSHRDSQPETSPRISHPGFSTGNMTRNSHPGFSPGFSAGNISPGFSTGILTGILNRKPLPGMLIGLINQEYHPDNLNQDLERGANVRPNPPPPSPQCPAHCQAQRPSQCPAAMLEENYREATTAQQCQRKPEFMSPKPLSPI